MANPDALVELGLWGLFVAAFLAGSILPFASEAVLTGVLLLGAPAGKTVAVATAGNVLGALTVYAIGRAASAGRHLENKLLTKWFEHPSRVEAAAQRIERWGPPMLLFAWLPLVGDVLVLAAGLARLSPLPVTFFVTVGKAARYGAVAWTVLTIAS